MNKFSKVVGYKIDIQTSVAFLYTKDKISKKVIKKAVLITILTKIIKYLGIILTKEVKDLCNKKYKTDERDWRRHKLMERYSMFMDWKN